MGTGDLVFEAQNSGVRVPNFNFKHKHVNKSLRIQHTLKQQKLNRVQEHGLPGSAGDVLSHVSARLLHKSSMSQRSSNRELSAAFPPKSTILFLPTTPAESHPRGAGVT